MKFKILPGRNVTLKMGMGHPGYEFNIDEVGGNDPAETVQGWIDGGFIESVGKPEEIELFAPNIQDSIVNKSEGIFDVTEESPGPEEEPESEKRGPGRPPGSGAKRK